MATSDDRQSERGAERRRRGPGGLGLAERLQRIVRVTTEGCWLWPEGRAATISVQGRIRASHVAAYELQYGPLPKGARLLLSCGEPRCVNPDHRIRAHLQDYWPLDTPPPERLPSRSTPRTLPRPLKATCRHGHPYNEVNTYWNNGTYYCRACRQLRTQRAQERHRAAKLATKRGNLEN
jgi:hypothetical protein